MSLRDDEQTLERIRELTKIGWAKGASPIDKLISENYFTEPDLVFVYDDVTASEGARVTAGFTLQFPVHLPHKRWLKVRSEFGHPYIALTPVGDDTIAAETRVFISFQLWYRRREVYDRYLECLDLGTNLFKTKKKSNGIWKTEEYEVDVLNRLYLQSIQVLKEFLPLYQVVSNDPDPTSPESLENFFIMMRNGRVVAKLQNRETGSDTQRRAARSSDSTLVKSFVSLERRIKRNIPPSVYELNLLEIRRLIDRGNFDLALVQTVVILDWFANEIIESHLISKISKGFKDESDLSSFIVSKVWEDRNNDNGKIRVNTLAKFQRYFPLIGLPLSGRLLESLKSMNSSRNDVVHRYKPKKTSRTVAESALADARAIIQETMQRLIMRKETREPRVAETKID